MNGSGGKWKKAGKGEEEAAITCINRVTRIGGKKKKKSQRNKGNKPRQERG